MTSSSVSRGEASVLPLNDRIIELLQHEDEFNMKTLSCCGWRNCGHCCRHCSAGASVNSLECPYATRHRINGIDSGDGAKAEHKEFHYSFDKSLSCQRVVIIFCDTWLDALDIRIAMHIARSFAQIHFSKCEEKKICSSIYRSFQLESERPIKIPSLSESKIMHEMLNFIRSIRLSSFVEYFFSLFNLFEMRAIFSLKIEWFIAVSLWCEMSSI